jgi:hypothetical protein
MADEPQDTVVNDGPDTRSSRWRGRRRIGAIGALSLAVLMVTVAVVLSAGGDAEGDESASRSTATTKIERKDLVESEEVDGTLGYADSRNVINRLSGTVTWLPKQGSVVKTGEKLFEVNGKPVFLLDGTYPAYRSLRSGRQGRDVAQLERSLRELGFDEDKDMAIDSEWTSATTAAVERWQRSHGLEEDGSIEVGRVVFQPGDRRIGEQLVDIGGSADSGGTGGGGGGGNATGTTGASYDSGTEGRTIFASLPAATASQTQTPTPTPTPTPTATQTPTPTSTPTPMPSPSPTPSPEPSPQPTPTSTPTPSAPSTGGGFSGGGGGGFSGGGGSAPSTGGSATAQSAASGGQQSVASEILTTTSRRRVVTVDLETTKVRLAQRGAEVEVEMPDGDDVGGRITQVGRVAETTEQSDGTESDPTIELTIRLRKTEGFVIDQAPVDVQLERRRAEDVLTVPVTALLAQSGGRFVVEVVESGGRRRVVPVKPGLYTDGDVEIEGEGLEEGMTVTDARV